MVPLLSIKPGRDGAHHQEAHHHDPDDGDGDEDLPAEPHNLVVTVARERRPLGGEVQDPIGAARDDDLFDTSLTTSAIGWSQPRGPTRFAPMRTCM